MSDPYDAHAYFCCGFVCDACGAVLEPEPGFEGCSDPDLRRVADQARAAGWWVPLPEGPEGRMDPWICRCPGCAGYREPRGEVA